MSYKYGETFERLGIPGLGRIGAGWSAIDPQGILVIMSHQNFYRREGDRWIYHHPGDPRTPATSPSASRSIKLIANYFDSGKREVLLPVGKFESDGGWNADGKHLPSKFGYATGDVYRGTLREFDPATAHFICDISGKFSV